jgi:hypothetical protein
VRTRGCPQPWRSTTSTIAVLSRADRLVANALNESAADRYIDGGELERAAWCAACACHWGWRQYPKQGVDSPPFVKRRFPRRPRIGWPRIACCAAASPSGCATSDRPHCAAPAQLHDEWFPCRRRWNAAASVRNESASTHASRRSSFAPATVSSSPNTAAVSLSRGGAGDRYAAAGAQAAAARGAALASTRWRRD